MGLPFKKGLIPTRMDFKGLLFYCTQGKLVLSDSLSKPNGIPNRPTGSTCMWPFQYPSSCCLYQYDIEKPAKVSYKRVFFDVTHWWVNKANKDYLMAFKTNSKALPICYRTGWHVDFNSFR